MTCSRTAAGSRPRSRFAVCGLLVTRRLHAPRLLGRRGRADELPPRPRHGETTISSAENVASSIAVVAADRRLHRLQGQGCGPMAPEVRVLVSELSYGGSLRDEHRPARRVQWRCRRPATRSSSVLCWVALLWPANCECGRSSRRASRSRFAVFAVEIEEDMLRSRLMATILCRRIRHKPRADEKRTNPIQYCCSPGRHAPMWFFDEDMHTAPAGTAGLGTSNASFALAWDACQHATAGLTVLPKHWMDANLWNGVLDFK